MKGRIIGVIKVDTRSLDHSSCAKVMEWPFQGSTVKYQVHDSGSREDKLLQSCRTLTPKP